MWLKDRLAVISTPRSVNMFATSSSEKLVAENVRQRYGLFRRLDPITRAEEWVSLGVVDFAASYLRRSLIRPSRKKEMIHRALVNKFAVLWEEGDVEGIVEVTEQIGNLRVRRASVPHIFS